MLKDLACEKGDRFILRTMSSSMPLAGNVSVNILRHQPDGNWLIALDNPWGTNIVA